MIVLILSVNCLVGIGVGVWVWTLGTNITGSITLAASVTAILNALFAIANVIYVVGVLGKPH